MATRTALRKTRLETPVVAPISVPLKGWWVYWKEYAGHDSDSHYRVFQPALTCSSELEARILARRQYRIPAYADMRVIAVYGSVTG